MKKQLIIFLAMVVFVFAGSITVYQTKAEELSSKLKGRILLQIESHGEAWYVNPKDSKRYYMANGSAAYNIMRDLGVGITNINLAKIKADKAFAKKQQGKIFLQIELHGEAYYIDINGVAHYLKDGSAAYSIMRELGLGIKTVDLTKINLADADKDKSASKDMATSSAPAVAVDNYDFKISSLTCTLTDITKGGGPGEVAAYILTYVRAIMNGTAQGPVGAQAILTDLIWTDDKFDCGAWTYSSYGKCVRAAGQPETTTWSVDTGGEEQGGWLRGETKSYTVGIYKKGDSSYFNNPQKEDKKSTVCQ